MASKPDFLAKVPLLRELDATELRRCADAMHMEAFGRGQNLFEVGDPGSSLYIVTKGNVQVLQPVGGTHVQLARMGAGDFIGEMAILDDAPRSATVRALDDVEALVLGKDDFRALVRERPEVGLKLLEVMTTRIRNADEQISGLSGQTARDPASGVLNRFACDQRLEEETARSKRYGSSFSLVMVHVADLGIMADSLGFDFTDRVLAWVGRLLTEHTRGSDVTFRCERDVFGVLCPCTPSDSADLVGARLVTLLAEARAPVDAGITLRPAAASVTCPDDGKEASPLYLRAQMALDAARAR